MPKLVLINADDLGLTPAVSEGIVEAMLNGAVATTSAMVCRDGSRENLARTAPRIPGRVGLHLQLTCGRPRCHPSEVPSLVGTDGRFPRRPKDLGSLDPLDVQREWREQARVLREWGIEPVRLDSHHHVHLVPEAFEVYCELAREMDLPARGGGPAHDERLRALGIACPDVFITGYFGGELDLESLLEHVAAAARECPDGGVIEVMSHPGRVDDELRRGSTYVDERERELRTLTSPDLPRRLREAGVELAGPDALRARG